MIDANAFNFDAMKEVVGNPFEDKNNGRYARDERFYVLQKDKNGNGAALIRFLPDSEKSMIQKLFKINTTIIKNGKRRFVSEFTPSTIGQACPFQEKWQELWNAGDKEEARLFSRSIKYVANIKVLKDPANPENEGKIFLYEMSGAMKDKIQNALDPSEQDRSLGATPKELFNPLKGNSFRLVAKKGANGQINYDSSEVVNEVTSIYGSVEEALEDIKNNTHSLSDLLKPESFMTYDQLKDKLNWVTFGDIENITSQNGEGAQQTVTTTVAEAPAATPEVGEAQTQQAAPAQQQQTQQGAPAAQAESLDSLLDGLL